MPELKLRPPKKALTSARDGMAATYLGRIASGGGRDGEDQRHEVDKNSQSDQGDADEGEENEGQRVKPQEADDFDEESQSNQGAREAPAAW